MANEIHNSTFTKAVTCSASDQSLDFLTSRYEIALISTGDCFINFDDQVTSTNRYLLKANSPVVFTRAYVRKLHYLADSGTPTLYVMAIKSLS